MRAVQGLGADMGGRGSAVPACHQGAELVGVFGKAENGWGMSKSSVIHGKFRCVSKGGRFPVPCSHLGTRHNTSVAWCSCLA